MQPSAADVAAMRLALEQARSCRQDIPVGAVVLDADGEVIGCAGNEREALQDPTAHAEVLALRRAAERLGSWRLTGCTLAVTLEPCPMCAGAAALARVDRVVFGAWNVEYGASGSRWDILRDRRMAHRPEVVGGVLEQECGTLVREFLASHRDSAREI
jgi:tRNA(adenine34) deaminase